MLPVQLQIDIGNAIGMRVVILLSRAGAPVGAATVGADNANGCVNGYLCYMDSLWHQLARHTLRGPLPWEAAANALRGSRRGARW